MPDLGCFRRPRRNVRFGRWPLMGFWSSLWSGVDDAAGVVGTAVEYGAKQPKEWKNAVDAVAGRSWFPSIFKEDGPD